MNNKVDEFLQGLLKISQEDIFQSQKKDIKYGIKMIAEVKKELINQGFSEKFAEQFILKTLETSERK